MKNKYLLIAVIALIFNGLSMSAQESVTKEVLLTTLNSVNELGFSNLKTSQLMEYNTEFVDKVYEILDGDKVEKDKKKALETLNNSRELDLPDLLGKKESKKYFKLMEDSLKPLIKKNKLLKEIA